MKKSAILIILALFFYGSVYGQTSADLDNIPDLKEAWSNFKEAVKHSDKNQLKILCADSVIFSMVIGDMNLLSSEAEESLTDISLENNSEHKNYFYVSFDSFYQEELQFVFDNDLIARMDDISMLRIEKNKDNLSEYRFFITVADPDEDFGGIEMALRFKKASNGYQFCGIDTVQ